MSNLKENLELFDKEERMSLDGFTESDIKHHPKAKALIELFEAVKLQILKDSSELFDKFDVNFNISAINPGKHDQFQETLVNAMSFKYKMNGDAKETLDITANFNFTKLCSMPSTEAYATMYCIMHDACLKKKQLISGSSSVKFGKENDVDESQTEQNESSKTQDEKTISQYFKEFLKKLLGLENVDENELSLVSQNLAKEFGGNGIKAGDLFADPNGKNLLAERYGKVVSQGHHAQATYLAGVISQDDFQAVRSNDINELKSFCIKFSKEFLANYNISPDAVEITFLNEGAEGSFKDKRDAGQAVNYNLRALQALNNPAEIVMAMAHELTHAVDCIDNKSKGLQNANGTGLRYNLVGGSRKGIERFMGQGESQEVENFLQELEATCYKINPNERSARMGELVALEFMEKMQTDDTMKKYMKQSIKSFQDYQKETNEAIALSRNLESEYRSGIQGMVRSLDVKKHIESRLSYIKELASKGMLKQSDEGIKSANAVMQNLNAQQEGLVQPE